MAQEPIGSFKSDFTDTMETLFHQLVTRLVSEWEIMTGKKMETPVSVIESETMGKFKNLVSVVEDFEKVANQPLTPESAKTRLQLYNRILRMIIRGIPRGLEPSEYVIQQIERFGELPASFTLPDGLDYETKHFELRTYICELVASVDKSEVDTFLQNCLSEHLVVPQLQRAFNKALLPKELRKPLVKTPVKSADRVKLALHHVTADWGVLVDVLYGLVILGRKKKPELNSIHRVTLWDKVEAISREPRLISLAKPEWVTVRNSIDHGRAFYDPSTGCIEFPDRTRKVSWSVERAYREAIDIYLSIEAMMRIWTFMQVAYLPAFRNHLAQLKSLAQQ